MQIQAILARPTIATNTWTILLQNEWGNLTYFERKADTPRIPASNTKVWTTACAYELFGPDKVWPWDDGHTISEGCTDILKPSWNDGADHLLDFIGSELAGTSSRAAAGQFVLDWAQDQVGLNMTGAAMGDGCGLDRENHFSARQMVGIFRHMHNNHPKWQPSLPVGCVDGTLSSRFCGPDTKGRVHAKTGTLHDVHAVSGYVENRHDGQTYFFSVLTNNCVDFIGGNSARAPESLGGFAAGASVDAIDAIASVMGQAGLPNPIAPHHRAVV